MHGRVKTDLVVVNDNGRATYLTVQRDRRQQNVIALLLFGDADPFGAPPELAHVP
ncbi:MAG TPA: hypothetical protein VM694_01740 [Polyangium sp.]|nr:hypothetical protein [Polyangium sp.]